MSCDGQVSTTRSLYLAIRFSLPVCPFKIMGKFGFIQRIYLFFNAALFIPPCPLPMPIWRKYLPFLLCGAHL